MFASSGILLLLGAVAIAGQTATITSNSIEADCMLPLPRLSFFAPIVYTANGVVRSTEISSTSNEPVIRIPAGEAVVLACAPNFFKFHPTSSVQATCKTGQTLIVNDHEHHFRKGLGCEVRAIEEIIKPVRGCGPTLTGTEYGLTNPVNNKSYVLGEACYDELQGRTKFAHTTFRSDYKNYDLDRTALRIVDDAGYFRQSHPASRYKTDFLIAARMDTLSERLTARFGFRQAPQLEPYRFVGEDLLLNQQFNNVLKLGWNYMMVSTDLVSDRMVQAVADLRQKLSHEGVADVYVGTHGILRTMDMQGANTEVFLTDDRFPVAKFIWMVAVTRQSNKAVAYVVPNGVGQSAEELCPNQCARGTPQQPTTAAPAMKRSATAAQVHCCEYKDLQAQVAEMPQLDGMYTLLQ